MSTYFDIPAALEEGHRTTTVTKREAAMIAGDAWPPPGFGHHQRLKCAGLPTELRVGRDFQLRQRLLFQLLLHRGGLERFQRSPAVNAVADLRLQRLHRCPTESVITLPM
jgi:hypothetical protein